MNPISRYVSIAVMMAFSFLAVTNVSAHTENKKAGHLPKGIWVVADDKEMIQLGMEYMQIIVHKLHFFENGALGIYSVEGEMIVDIEPLENHYYRLKTGSAMMPDLLIRFIQDGDNLYVSTGRHSVKFRSEAPDPVDIPELRKKMSEQKTQSDLARTKANLRMIQTAIEVYYIDCNRYPAHTEIPTESIEASLASSHPDQFENGSFFRKPEGRLMTLTTPIAYISSYPEDTYAEPDGRTFQYFNTDRNWILWSPGPDGDYDILAKDLQENPSMIDMEFLRSHNGGALTYDPSNGAVSNGDVWRVHD